MELGATVAGRFRIEARVGAGAMGEVFRAADLNHGRTVAVKVLRPNVPEGAPRFAREIRALERLRHEGVVAHVSHGAEAEERFLVMEWLDGEDLRHRLARQALTIEEAVELGRALADALAHVHERGAVHRDVKPSNVILDGGAVARPKLVDFGLARLLDDRDLTNDFESADGILIGTPGYMAPEQTRGKADAAADVFALGCLLYKCITGQTPFHAPDIVGTLARVLFDEPARPCELVRDLPEAIDELLVAMIAKDPAARPTARSVCEALRAHRRASGRPSVPPPPPRALGHRERRLVSVVVTNQGHLGGAETTLHGTLGAPIEVVVEVRHVAERLGARVEFLGPSVLAVFADAGSAQDQAARAARLGLELVRLMPHVPVAVTTGRVEVAQRVVGEAVDHAIAIARRSPTGRLAAGPITVGLLGGDFQVDAAEDVMLVVRELPRAEAAPRTLLGRPTPCVGRERELAELDASLADVKSEERPIASLLVGPSGIGKSRLRWEWLARLRAREPSTSILRARCDAMVGTVPLALAADLIRSAAGVTAADSPAQARARIAARVRALAHGENARLTEFLAEIAGANDGAPASVQLAAARDDPMLMGDQVRAAFTGWMALETQAAPLVAVIDDLQWADAASVRLLDAALAAGEGSPLFVVAFARPEVRTTFPALFDGRSLHERRLPEISKAAAAELIGTVLGQQVSAEDATALAQRAAGNAFFLEEMIRAHAEGAPGDAPPTVQAVVQRRLESFDGATRRALRAAAIFGMTFWTGAVRALAPDDDGMLGPLLRVLRDREVVTARPTSRFEGDEEWVFRHAYVREAAYAMLTEDDKVLGHALAAEWLEAHGERDALLLADHFERGGQFARAVPHLRRAAKQGLDANDLDLAVRLAEHARAQGVTGEPLGELARYAAEALRWRARLPASEEWALLAMEHLSPSSPTWYAAVGELAAATTAQGHLDGLARARALLVEDAFPTAFPVARVVALSRVAAQHIVAGKPDEAEELLRAAEACDVEGSPRAHARLAQSRGIQALATSDPARYREWTAKATALFEAIGDRRNACVSTTNMGCAIQGLGRWREAIDLFVPARAVAVTLGLPRIIALIDQNLALARLESGEVEASVATQRTSVEFFAAQGDRRLESSGRMYLARALEAAGRDAEAFAAAERAFAVSAPLRPVHAAARAALADLELRKGDPMRARELVVPALEAVEELGGLEEGEALVRIVYVDVMLRLGEREAAERELGRALGRIAERIAGIEAEWRASFVGEVPEHLRVIARARELGVALPAAIAEALAGA
jgi:tetratricopeptide (TPR) repeat protein